MADKTGISWTDATWSPVVGCSRVSEGCRNCYSERLVATRLRHTEKYAGLAQMTQAGPRWTNVVRCLDSELLKPLSWKKPRRIFVNSMSDTFHKDVPFEFLDRVFAIMALCPQHTFQVLTKRPERAAEYFAQLGLLDRVYKAYWQELCRSEGPGFGWPLPNVWIGTSAEDQKAADERMPHLLKIPAAVRFLSCEPLLGRLNLERWLDPCRNSGRVDGPLHSWEFDGDDPYVVCYWCEERRDSLSGRTIGTPERKAPGIHWVIAGGESGPNARPMNPTWAESLQRQCEAAKVPFHFKQVGEWDCLVPERAPYYVSAYSGKEIDGHALPDFGDLGDPRNKRYDVDLEEGVVFHRAGVKANGHLLGGKEYRAFPEAAR